jgi:hypothetical protein
VFLLRGSRDLLVCIQPVFVCTGSLVFVNSMEYRVMNIDVIVIEMLVLFERAKDVKSFQPGGIYVYHWALKVAKPAN